MWNTAKKRLSPFSTASSMTTSAVVSPRCGLALLLLLSIFTIIAVRSWASSSGTGSPVSCMVGAAVVVVVGASVVVVVGAFVVVVASSPSSPPHAAATRERAVRTATAAPRRRPERRVNNVSELLESGDALVDG